MPISESGITLTFPDNNFFRFQDCQGYRDIQNYFKEMDICWYDQHSDTLYIVGLKDWGNGKLVEEQDPNYDVNSVANMKNGITNSRINTLFKKSIDSTAMFVSILLNRSYSLNIQNCSPFTITSASNIILLSIINWTSSDNSYISSINSIYKSHFKPYAKLFGVKSYVIMTKTQAAHKFAWVS